MRLLSLLRTPKTKKTFRVSKPNKKIETFVLFDLSLSFSLSFSRGGWKGTTTTNQLHPEYYYYCYCFPLRPLLRRVFHLFHASKHVTLVISTISARVRSRRLFYSISKTDEQLSHNITQGRTPDILSRACTLASFLYERDLFVPKKRRS